MSEGLYKDEDGWHYTDEGCGCCSCSYGGEYGYPITRELMEKYRAHLKEKLEQVELWFKDNPDKKPKEKEVGKQ